MAASDKGTDLFSQQAREEPKRFQLREEYENMGEPLFEKQKYMLGSVQASEEPRGKYLDSSISPSETRFKQGKKHLLKQVIQEQPRIPMPTKHYKDDRGEESPSRKDLTDLDHHPTLQNERNFYLKERAKRPLYQDPHMHALVLSLIMCLLLKP